MRRSLLVILAASLVGVAACSNGHSVSSVLPGTGGQTPSGHLRVRHLQSGLRPLDLAGGGPAMTVGIALVDAPLLGAASANAQFNAGVLGVDAIAANGDSWQLIGNNAPQVINVMALQRSALDLGSGTLPAGSYSALQLLLDPATTNVTYNGRVYPVVIVDPRHPWWDETATIEAVTVPLAISGNANASLKATLDFNVFQSADLRDGVVYLTPTVAGGLGEPQIAGTVRNAAGAAVVNATVLAIDASGATANVTVTSSDGTFRLRGLSPGSYAVRVVNTFTTNAGVTVIAGGADAGASPSTSVVVGPSSKVDVGTLQD